MRIMRLAVLTAVLGLASATARAQSTNFIQHANFVLKATKQTDSGVTSVRVGNKDIIAALNASGAYHFGSRAALFLESSDDQPTAIIVREGTGQQVTNTDVSAYFGVSEIGSEVQSRNDLTQWQTWNFAFDNASTNNETSFQLWGLTTIKMGAVRGQGIGPLTGFRSEKSNVVGVGRLQSARTVFSGTVSGSGASLVIE